MESHALDTKCTATPQLKCTAGYIQTLRLFFKFVMCISSWCFSFIFHKFQSDVMWPTGHPSVFQHQKRSMSTQIGWWSGVVVSALALINKVNQRRARLVLRWTTVSGFNSRCRTFISVCNQPATQGQLSRPSLQGW